MKAARGLGNVFQPKYVDKRALAKYLADGLSPEDARKQATRTCATWWIVYHVNGRRHAENAHTTNRADAVRLLKKKTGDAAIGLPVGPQLDRTTVNDLLAMVEADYKANSRRSLDRVQQAGAHLRAFFRGERKARDITADLITAYQAHRLAGKKCERCDGTGKLPPANLACAKCEGSGDITPAHSTVNYEVAMLRRGFHLGARAGKVGVRPEVAMLHIDNARQGFFEPDQYRAVLAHLPDYLQPVATVAYISGWRVKSELLSRQWRHVDFANGWIRLDPGESKNGEGREFPFTPQLRTVLEAQRDRVRAFGMRTGQLIPWLFCHNDGSPIQDFRGAWAKACLAAGVPGRLVHDLRRTAIRNLERAGVPRSAAMKLTGHKTEAVYRRYAITDSAMLQEAAEKLATLHAAEAAQTEKRQSIAKVSSISAQ